MLVSRSACPTSPLDCLVATSQVGLCCVPVPTSSTHGQEEEKCWWADLPHVPEGPLQEHLCWCWNRVRATLLDGFRQREPSLLGRGGFQHELGCSRWVGRRRECFNRSQEGFSRVLQKCQTMGLESCWELKSFSSWLASRIWYFCCSAWNNFNFFRVCVNMFLCIQKLMAKGGHLWPLTSGCAFSTSEVLRQLSAAGTTIGCSNTFLLHMLFFRLS